MTTLIQLSATSWLNTDLVTLIRQDGPQVQVWVSGQAEPLTLTADEAKTLAYHVRRHAEKTAYRQSHPRTPPEP